MEKSKHNGIISFWKFMFTLMIIAGHITTRVTQILAQKLPITNTFRGSSIGVEFFFIVSGYLMTKNAIKKEIKDNKELGEITFNYIWKKVKTFFPYILTAYICALLLHINISNLQKYQIVNTIWDVLLLRMSGLNYFHGILGVAWYISAMLICMIVLYPLIIKYKKNFIYIIAPINVILIGGYIAHQYGNITAPEIWTGIIYKSLLRAYFELSLGSIAYMFSEKLKNVNFTKLGKVLITCVEVLGYSSIFYLVNRKDAHNRYDFIMILILFACISISFSGKSLLQKFSNNKVFYFLERISLPIYLNQIWIIELFLYILKWNNITNVNYYFTIICIIGIIFIISLIMDLIVKLIKRAYPKVKALLIQEVAYEDGTTTEK